MAQFNMPLHHVQMAEDKYVSMERYHGNGMNSPQDLGPWMEQSEGGGKFQLKRRRRCGQCGPCQVKDNCNKCQYCLRKDVLKQACVQRKCVYLRKPVPRFHPEAASSDGSGGGSGGGILGVATNNVNTNSNGSSSSSKESPLKPSPTPSVAPTPLQNRQSTPAPVNPSAVAAAAAVVQSAELSSCQSSQNSFSMAVPPNGVADSRRLEQPRSSALLDASGVLESRAPYLPGHRATVEAGRSPAQVMQHNNNSNSSIPGTANGLTTSPMSSATKETPLPPREQFRSPMEQWSAVPYGFPHPNPWAHPALQPSPVYGFQAGANHYSSPFGSSCQLGMADAAGPFPAVSQPSFHHNMPFSHHDFSAHTNFHTSAPSMQSAMTAPFYPPPHIPPSLPNFPSFNQLPSSAGPHGAYPMPHPPVYPGSFYSLRPSSEPQIYHVRLSLPATPFAPSQDASWCGRFSQFLLSDKESEGGSGKEPVMGGENEKDEVTCVKLSLDARCSPPFKPVCDVMGDVDKTGGAGCPNPKAAKVSLFGEGLTAGQKRSKLGSLQRHCPRSGPDKDLKQLLEQAMGSSKCYTIHVETLANFRSDETSEDKPSNRRVSCRLSHLSQNADSQDKNCDRSVKRPDGKLTTRSKSCAGDSSPGCSGVVVGKCQQHGSRSACAKEGTGNTKHSHSLMAVVHHEPSPALVPTVDKDTCSPLSSLHSRGFQQTSLAASILVTERRDHRRWREESMAWAITEGQVKKRWREEILASATREGQVKKRSRDETLACATREGQVKKRRRETLACATREGQVKKRRRETLACATGEGQVKKRWREETLACATREGQVKKRRREETLACATGEGQVKKRRREESMSPSDGKREKVDTQFHSVCWRKGKEEDVADSQLCDTGFQQPWETIQEEEGVARCEVELANTQHCETIENVELVGAAIARCLTILHSSPPSARAALQNDSNQSQSNDLDREKPFFL